MNLSLRHENSENNHCPLYCAHPSGCEWQTNERITWQPSDFNLWPAYEPLVWTSLPVRRNGLVAPDIIYFPSRGVSCNVTVEDIAYRGHAFSYACGDEAVRKTVPTRNDYSNTCFTCCESQTPHCTVFPDGGSYDTESNPSEYVDSLKVNCDIYSNDSEEDVVSDYYDNCECEICSNVNKERDVMNNHYNLPVALEDLDYILRMLPSTLIERDSFLKHMTDEEVALIMYNHVDDDEDDEEIVSLNIIHEDVYDARLPDPVACLLERTTNEYFLPISCDTLKDKR
ncbi:hypothetical protein BsWGS_00829 [Bradybaena similaris]